MSSTTTATGSSRRTTRRATLRRPPHRRRSRTPAPRADTLHVLPTAWYRNTWAWEVDADAPVLRAGADDVAASRRSIPSSARSRSSRTTGLAARHPSFSSATTRRMTSGCSAPAGGSPYPKDGINDHVVSRPAHRQPGSEPARRRRSITASPSRRARRSSYVSACARLRRPRRRGPTSTTSWRRVAARPTSSTQELTPPACSDDEANVMRQAFAGMLWGKQLYYYDVKRWLAGDPTQPQPPGVAPRRQEPPLDHLRGVRHHVDARSVGVPVVRRVGLGVSLHRARPRRSGIREVPADPPLPRVVPASERRAARVRVGVRRRQPPGAGVGCAAGLRDRRRPRRGISEPYLRQAAGQLHLVGEPARRRRLERVRGGIPRPRQHRPDRPLPPPERLHAGAGGRDGLDGGVCADHGGDRRGAQPDA